MFRGIVASVIIGVLLAASLFLIFIFKKKSIDILNFYPNVSCQSMDQIYEDKLLFYGLKEYESYYIKKDSDSLSG